MVALFWPLGTSATSFAVYEMTVMVVSAMVIVVKQQGKIAKRRERRGDEGYGVPCCGLTVKWVLESGPWEMHVDF